jgi:hypothetical protein
MQTTLVLKTQGAPVGAEDQPAVVYDAVLGAGGALVDDESWKHRDRVAGRRTLDADFLAHCYDRKATGTGLVTWDKVEEPSLTPASACVFCIVGTRKSWPFPIADVVVSDDPPQGGLG